jgi:hypothetical protein
VSKTTFLKETDDGELFIELSPKLLEKLQWDEKTKLKIEVAFGWDLLKPNSIVISESTK